MIEYVLALIVCASIGCLAYSIGLVAKNLQEVQNVLQKIKEEIRYGCTLYEKYNGEIENKKIDYAPYPVYPTTGSQIPDWWRNPSVTWSYDDATVTNMTNPKQFTPVRDVMTGKKVTDEHV